MGPGNRRVNEASEPNRQVPGQRQWNSATQAKGDLTTVAVRREGDRAPACENVTANVASFRANHLHRLHETALSRGAVRPPQWSR
jgi:hypothetical protein